MTTNKPSTALLTDFYQLTMAYGYWKAGVHENDASFSIIFRRNPFQGGYAICAGLADVIEFINNFTFAQDDIEYLKSLRNEQVNFPDEFLEYLKKLRFSCDVEAIEEGTLVFPQEPLIRISGPLLQCQLLETPLLNIVNFQTLIATKASRICHAARGEPVIEFGLRRAQGPDGGITASRAAYIGGCVATSNVLAGKKYDIPLRGTHAHSWIMVFPTEIEAFEIYAKAFPNNTIFLVDTYNTLQGVKNAIEVGKKLQLAGHKFLGVRLDSGDLAYLSIEAKKLLDAAGFKDAMILGSNDLNEHIIASLKEQGAKINVWGVGTHLATAYSQPALDGVYKLTAIRSPGEQWQYKLKLSEQVIKISTPGLLKVRRYFDDEYFVADAVYDEQLGISASAKIIDPADPLHQLEIKSSLQYVELSTPIFQKGKLIYKVPSIHESREKTSTQLSKLHETTKRFLNPHIYPVGLEEKLYELKTKLILEARGAKR